MLGRTPHLGVAELLFSTVSVPKHGRLSARFSTFAFGDFALIRKPVQRSGHVAELSTEAALLPAVNPYAESGTSLRPRPCSTSPGAPLPAVRSHGPHRPVLTQSDLATQGCIAQGSKVKQSNTRQHAATHSMSMCSSTARKISRRLGCGLSSRWTVAAEMAAGAHGCLR